MVEYALIAALVAIVTVPIVRNVGTSVSRVFSTINRSMSV
jgi:Flp pilus assembly pilin Flp